jgi:hypothetical protein
LKIALEIYKISIVLLNMENGVEAYSMLLGQPWLKHPRAHHNWDDNTNIITLGE